MNYSSVDYNIKMKTISVHSSKQSKLQQSSTSTSSIVDSPTSAPTSAAFSSAFSTVGTHSNIVQTIRIIPLVVELSPVEIYVIILLSLVLLFKYTYLNLVFVVETLCFCIVLHYSYIIFMPMLYEQSQQLYSTVVHWMVYQMYTIALIKCVMDGDSSWMFQQDGVSFNHLRNTDTDYIRTYFFRQNSLLPNIVLCFTLIEAPVLYSVFYEVIYAFAIKVQEQKLTFKLLNKYLFCTFMLISIVLQVGLYASVPYDVFLVSVTPMMWIFIHYTLIICCSKESVSLVFGLYPFVFFIWFYAVYAATQQQLLHFLHPDVNQDYQVNK